MARIHSRYFTHRVPETGIMTPNATKTSAQALDDVLDQFEANWIPDLGFLAQIVAQAGFHDQPQAIVELVRADVDRRYMAGASVQISDYLPLFPSLVTYPSCLHAIAFEDFRARRSRGLSLHQERWAWIPGIQHAEWYTDFQKLSRDSIRPMSHRSGSDSPTLLASSMTDSEVEPEIGKPFGDFQLLAFLGSGTFSRVFLATQRRLASRFVALKVVRKVLDEPTHLATLQHTGIIPIYSLHRIGDYSALCMPYYGAATLADWMDYDQTTHQRDGKSLVDTVKRAKTRIDSLDWQAGVEPASVDVESLQSIRIGNQSPEYPLSRLASLDTQACVLWLASRLAAALAHAHDRGVVHGDIKPANVLLRNDGEPSLIDFNLALNREVESSQVGGTLPYMPPEQLQILIGKKERITAASDIYSLGLVLYQMVEGKLPFPVPVSLADSDVEVALKSRRQPIRWTSRKASPSLQAIIEKCLAYEPLFRYRDGSQLLEDLEREATHRSLRHSQEPLRSRIVKCTKRYPRLFSTIPVVLASLAILGILGSIATYSHRLSQQWLARSALREWRDTMNLQFPSVIEGTPASLQRSVDTWVPLFESIGISDPVDLSDTQFAWLPDSERLAAESEVRDDLAGITTLLRERQSELEPASQKTIAKWSMPRSTKDGSTSLYALSFPALWQARNDLKHNRPAQAREAITKLQPRPSLKALYWIVLGDAERALGNFESAELSYGFLIRDFPHSPLGYTRRSQLLASARKWDRAEQDLSRLVELEPKQTAYRAERARVREKMGRLEEAILDLDAAIALEPTANRLYFFRSRLRQLQGQTESAKADFQQGMRRPPGSTEDWISRALAHLPRSPNLALNDLKEAERLAPNRFEVHQNRAHVLSKYLHDDQGALTSLETILEKDPKNEWARIDRCVLLARTSRTDQALAEAHAIVDEGGQLAPATHYQLACVHSLLMTTFSESRDAAFRFLSLALTQGYGNDLMASDPDLDPLRQDPRFQAIQDVVEWTRPDAMSNSIPARE